MLILETENYTNINGSVGLRVNPLLPPDEPAQTLRERLRDRKRRAMSRLCLHRILPLPILYEMYCNKGWSGGNTVLRNSVGDEGGGVGCQNKGGVCK